MNETRFLGLLVDFYMVFDVFFQVCLRPVGEFLGLKVPGLAEGRPSLIIGDRVILSEPGEYEGPRYEGCIHEVLNDEVLLKFQQNFHHDYLGQDYNVEFTFNRTPMRRWHQSVNFVQKLGEESKYIH
jgi:putative helicase MOV10L1